MRLIRFDYYMTKNTILGLGSELLTELRILCSVHGDDGVEDTPVFLWFTAFTDNLYYIVFREAWHGLRASTTVIFALESVKIALDGRSLPHATLRFLCIVTWMFVK